MASDEYLERMDRHLELGNELMQRIDAHIGDVRSEVQLTREVVRRNEIAFIQNSRTTADLAEVLREVKADLRQLGDEVRAQTQAIFRMLDGFDGGPSRLPSRARPSAGRASP